MVTSSASEFDASDASYSDTSSGALSFSYSTFGANHENSDLPMDYLEPYLYAPVESHSISSSDTCIDDDSQDCQRLLTTTWYRNVEFKLNKPKVYYSLQ